MSHVQSSITVSPTQPRAVSRKAVIFSILALAAFYLMVAHPAFAGTGNASQVSQRASGVATGLLGVLQIVGVAVLTVAFMWVGYSMAFGQKKWSDVANVAYGAFVAGLGGVLVGWLFN